MKCFSCELDLPIQTTNGYHEICAKKLFGVSWTPQIRFASDRIATEAQKLIGKMSISGVQPKLSVKLNKADKILEVVASGGSHILKPSPEQFVHLAENENMCMNLARELSIEIPPHGLLPLADGKLAYIVKRFDRSSVGEKPKLHVEDFAQILEKSDKYNGSIEQIGDAIKKFSTIPFIDTQKLFTRVLFNFLIGNGDAHLKNFSMIRYSQEGYKLSLAYDIVSSRLVMPNEADETALSINGKKNKITPNDFEALAKNLEIGDKQYSRILDMGRLLDNFFDDYLHKSFLPEELKWRFSDIFNKRYERLY